MQYRHAVCALVVAVAIGAPRAAHATFSIVACDAEKRCGAAVATNNLAVGATVIYAKAGVGALATQFETNPSYGPKGLAMLDKGTAPQATLDELLKTDGNFEGQDISFRQVGIVAGDGKTATYTGKQAAASPWAGSVTGPGYAIQGNGLAGKAVIDAMQAAFVRATGPLEERLLAALEAGEAAGGQTTGRMSAALIVRTAEGGFVDTDLRVDAAERPLRELRTLIELRAANVALIRAERAAGAKKLDEARELIAEGLRLGAGWDRIWRRAARLELQIGDINEALQALAVFARLNPTWAKLELDDVLYKPLWGRAVVQRWRAGRTNR